MNNDDNEKKRMIVDIINWVEIWIRTRDDSNNTVSGVTATLVPLQTIKQQSTYANIQLFIVVTSFVNINDDITNTVSNTLQVIISQVTLSSLQIRSIAITAKHIADMTNMNLTNFIALFIF